MAFLPLILLSLLVPGEADDVTTVALDPRGERLVEIVRRAEAAGFSGAMLAARGGEVVAATGVGPADARGKTPNTPATLFEIASITKCFTAVAVVRLAQEGKLGLDDSIADHLPDVREDCRAITVRHLLQHTSGIPGTNSQGSGPKIHSVLPQFLSGGPKHPPGTHYEYWNQGYALLSEIVARASGQEYVEFCRTALFAPAGMASTCFTGDPAPKGASVALGRSDLGVPRTALEHPYGDYGFQYRGMGGIVTSVRDLWRWDRALAGEALLDARSKEALFTPGLADYALGWRVHRNPQNVLVQSHGGKVRGFVGELRRYPKEDGLLVLLANRDDLNPNGLADLLERALLGDPAEVALPPRPLTEAQAQAVAGDYEDNQGRVLEVTADGPVTRARIRWSSSGPETRAILGLDESGGLVLFEWTATTPIQSDLSSGKKPRKVQRLALPKQEFRRKR